MKIYSIFRSIQGEVNNDHQGRLATFIRVPGCNLRCRYCDTMYAVNSTGTEMSINEIVREVEQTPKIKSITLTGGEPLIYEEDVIDLTKVLVKKGFSVNIETNGSKPIPFPIRYKASFIIDYKLPSSGEEDKMITDWYTMLEWKDWVKFVISDMKDLHRALKIEKEIVSMNPSFQNFAYSPCWGELDGKEIINFLIKKGLGFELFNLQIHKIIWEEGSNGESDEH